MTEAEKLTEWVLKWALRSVKPHPRYQAPCVNAAQLDRLHRKIKKFAKEIACHEPTPNLHS